MSPQFNYLQKCPNMAFYKTKINSPKTLFKSSFNHSLFLFYFLLLLLVHVSSICSS